MSQMDYASLDHLCETLNEMYSKVDHPEHCSQAMGRLFLIERTLQEDHTFGGEPPRDTRGIYSWDETRYLVDATGGGFEICSREEYED